jgi:hypothetical protein
METTVISKVARNGQTVEIKLGDGYDPIVYLGGKCLGSGSLHKATVKAIDPKRPVWIIATTPAISLTDAEAETIRAARTEAIRNRPKSLREQRDAIVSAIRSADGAARDAFERAMDRGDANVSAGPAKYKAEAAAARAQLAEFDAAHPEIAEQVRAEAEAKRAADLAETRRRAEYD